MLRLAALVPLALVACVDTGDEGIYVLNNTAVTEASCSLSGNPDQAILGHGMINYRSPSAYVMTPLVQSRIMPVEGIDEQSKTVQLRGADIALTLKAYTIARADGSFTIEQPEKKYPPFTSLFSGAIGPGASVNTFVDTIPPATLRQIAADTGANVTAEAFQAEVLATVVIRGQINDDTITSAPYLFPITVCNDCVVVNLGACPVMAAPRTGNACNPFQDGVVDCCTDASNNLVCPAPTAM
jgi:hypothetical protein